MAHTKAATNLTTANPRVTICHMAAPSNLCMLDDCLAKAARSCRALVVGTSTGGLILSYALQLSRMHESFVHGFHAAETECQEIEDRIRKVSTAITIMATLSKDCAASNALAYQRACAITHGDDVDVYIASKESELSRLCIHVARSCCVKGA